ncbi:hypothetical protein GCM10007304_28170 [Rhodococcoides trifolii]|uniref:Uncharacterized protein n=1 Tax=Rhodococcoides trifolii TaxID=908250 RepID=A0A917FXU3_9NOCA|nr:Rv3235 family protein [Rhodococcus trifolii]GGG12523.1 hypothetical protein GCM10007304_28170 [Rhodococcus trifolii]
MSDTPAQFPSYLGRAPRSEPPLVGSRTRRLPPHRLSHSRPGPHSGRSGRGPLPPSNVSTESRVLALQTVEVREFATSALRHVLEVVDRRRGASTVAHVLSPAVVGMVGALATAAVPGRHLGVAVLQRVHVSVVSPNHAEVFGTYSRGDRVFAIAAGARYRRSAGRAPSWSVTSLRLS